MLAHDDHARCQLTHDERKAAEAAFQGWEFNNAWFQAARNVYVGIRVTMMKVTHEHLMQEVHDTDRHPLPELGDGVLV